MSLCATTGLGAAPWSGGSRGSSASFFDGSLSASFFDGGQWCLRSVRDERSSEQCSTCYDEADRTEQCWVGANHS
eukprot:COSAG01_NODE_4347_length_5116_cov_11.269683_8_plen_75_part_00